MTDKKMIIEMPFYCKECGKCSDYNTVNKNLKSKRVMDGYCIDVYCSKRKEIVHRI